MTSPFDDVPFRSLQHPLGQLTDAERTAIETYALGNYERVNATLRGWRTSTPDIDNTVSLIRSALSRFPLDVDTRVTREANCQELDVGKPTDLPTTIGKAFRLDGFLSTSMSATPTRSSTRPNAVDIELVVPPGTPALALGELATYPLERELLIIDARLIYVVDCAEGAGRWRVYAQVLPDSEAESVLP